MNKEISIDEQIILIRRIMHDKINLLAVIEGKMGESTIVRTENEIDVLSSVIQTLKNNVKVGGMMSSEWRVTSNFIEEQKMYQVYRLRDTAEVDHSGNREYHGDYVKNRDEAVAEAAALNKEVAE